MPPPPATAMRHSLAEAQASSMHVALDCLPPPGLAGRRHHAANAVAAAGPCPSRRASATPAVTGPRRGPGAALPTLIRSPTDRHSEADQKQRNTDAQKKKRERERKTRWTEDETDVQVGQQSKEVSKISHRGGKDTLKASAVATSVQSRSRTLLRHRGGSICPRRQYNTCGHLKKKKKTWIFELSNPQKCNRNSLHCTA